MLIGSGCGQSVERDFIRNGLIISACVQSVSEMILTSDLIVNAFCPVHVV